MYKNFVNVNCYIKGTKVSTSVYCIVTKTRDALELDCSLRSLLHYVYTDSCDISYKLIRREALPEHELKLWE